MPRTITPEEYARYLVTAAQTVLGDDLARCGSWTDIHEVVDANEFLVEADEYFELPESQFGSPERLELANAAIEIADAVLFDAQTLRQIAEGVAFFAERENELEERGLIRQTDKPYAALTEKGWRILDLEDAWKVKV